jgi:hypothetical protein
VRPRGLASAMLASPYARRARAAGTGEAGAGLADPVPGDEARGEAGMGPVDRIDPAVLPAGVPDDGRHPALEQSHTMQPDFFFFAVTGGAATAKSCGSKGGESNIVKLEGPTEMPHNAKHLVVSLEGRLQHILCQIDIRDNRLEEFNQQAKGQPAELEKILFGKRYWESMLQSAMDDLETANNVLKKYSLGWDAADVSAADVPVDKQSKMLSRLKEGLPLVLSDMRHTRASLFDSVSKPLLEKVTASIDHERIYIQTMRDVMSKGEFNPDNYPMEKLLRETLIDMQILKVLQNETVVIDNSVFLSIPDRGFTRSYNDRVSNARLTAECICCGENHPPQYDHS